jgi:HSP20 family molecular chaperone IbpA
MLMTESPPSRPSGDRRLFAARVLVVALVAAAALVVYFCVVRQNRRPEPAPAVKDAVEPGQGGPVHADEPRSVAEPPINVYLRADVCIVVAVVPGVTPEAQVSYDPLTHRPRLKLWCSPPAEPYGDARTHLPREWKPRAFSRTITLPEDVSTPNSAVLKDGILTLSFPRTRSLQGDVNVLIEPGR